jgi:hypothetical protein
VPRPSVSNRSLLSPAWAVASALRKWRYHGGRQQNMPLPHRLVAVSVYPRVGFRERLAVNGTGFRRSVYDRYHTEKHGPKGQKRRPTMLVCSSIRDRADGADSRAGDHRPTLQRWVHGRGEK